MSKKKPGMKLAPRYVRARVTTTTSGTATVGVEEVKEDLVNHPKHYADTKIEPIDVIEDWELDFHEGNAVKYVKRAGKKAYPGKTLKESRIIDLEKMIWYLSRKVDLLKKNA